jgi:hypothetical protein
MKLAAMLAVGVLLLPLSAQAQALNLGALDGASHIVHVRTGAEYGFVAGVGYARIVALPDRSLVLTADATLPWAALDLNDYQLRVGGALPLVEARRWKLAAAIAPTLRGTRNELSRMTAVGTDVGVVAGYYAPRAFAAAELGFDGAFTTYVAHTQAYRQNLFAGARDGWYSMPGGNVRAGLQGGLSFGRYGVILRAGMVRDVSGEAPLIPFYGTLGVNARW